MTQMDEMSDKGVRSFSGDLLVFFIRRLQLELLGTQNPLRACAEADSWHTDAKEISARRSVDMSLFY